MDVLKKNPATFVFHIQSKIKLKSNEILEKASLGKRLLNNRMVMAPLTRCRANEKGVISELAILYYSQRATAGLIVSMQFRALRFLYYVNELSKCTWVLGSKHDQSVAEYIGRFSGMSDHRNLKNPILC